MARTHPKVPSYRRQTAKPHDRSFVKLNGERVYLGRYGSPEAKRRYQQVIAEWLANGQQPKVDPYQLTTLEVIDRYWSQHAATYYLDGLGQPTSQQGIVNMALRPVKSMYGMTRAVDFGPAALRAVRQRWIDAGLSRTTVNRYVRIVVSMFKWAASHELVPGSVHHALATVEGLRRGRSAAKENGRLRPVPERDIEAARSFVGRQVRAVIDLQLLTGARPGELLAMRAIDLDMSSKVWTYKPARHKTEHHGHERTIYIGPKAQDVIRPFLTGRPVDAFLFSPKEAESERLTARHEQRVVPIKYGNRPGTNRKRRPERSPGDRYDVASYRRAIERACKAGGVPVWRPHRLRHNAASQLRRDYGIDLAQTILGHQLGSAITEVYAEANVAKAMDVIAKVG